MELRLYKEPYTEPYTTDRLRLLFEGMADRVADQSGAARERRDLYLYVWIENKQTLWGFQAVLDEEFVFDFHAPAKVEFSRISGMPVKRSLSRPLTARERKTFLTYLKGLSNPEFPDLIKTIDAVAHGETAPALDLTKEEIAALNKLTEAK
jgi:hypothetical protein